MARNGKGPEVFRKYTEAYNGRKEKIDVSVLSFLSLYGAMS
jgi:tRNA(His) 5'-end guanylyltransferase